jgi:hypothetical protein
MTEIMLRDAGAAHGLGYVILRYFNVAGADPLGRTGQSDHRSHPSHQGRGRNRARVKVENGCLRHPGESLLFEPSMSHADGRLIAIIAYIVVVLVERSQND